ASSIKLCQIFLLSFLVVEQLNGGSKRKTCSTMVCPVISITSCTDFAGQLIESNSSSNDQVKALSRLTGGGSGRYWVSGSWGPNCAAALVRRGQISAVVLVPCRDELEGFACQYHPAHVCGALSGDVQYIINTTALFQLLDSDSPPPGTVALVGGAQQPASKHLCMGDWIQAPWNCEVMSGGCEHRCDPNTKTCTCPEAHGLQPNGFSCEDPCTAEGKECVDVSGGYRCVCAHGFAEDDGVCVNVSICLSCEHNCSKVAGVYRCKCMEGFTVDPENPTKCKPCEIQEGGCEHECAEDPSDSPVCFCPPGQTVSPANRVSCEAPAPGDPCAALRCQQTCYTDADGSARCGCEHGLTLAGDGTSCADVDECADARHCPGENVRCVNTRHGFECACEAGYKKAGVQCVDVDECVSAPCEHICTNAPGGFTCACYDGYRPDAEELNKCVLFCGAEECPAVCDPNDPLLCYCPEGYVVEERDKGICSHSTECVGKSQSS
uniref:Thrombomodulin n=1 Tax=Kryptolebias marmoratus TaxID=37003 RepID=A0A3Q3BAF9_KRYMA